MFAAFVEALGYLINPSTLGYVFIGTTAGLIFGVLPGLGGVAALAILLPLTYGMKPMVAMFFLASVMGAVPFGGSITAILLNTPGTPMNAATCLDGHPMARKGEARKALGIAATASGLGALFGILILLAILPAVRRIILLFGPPEFFVLILFGLATVALAAKGSFLKGLVAGGIGILLSLVGYSEVFGGLRFTYGSEYLWDGFSLVPVLVGIFAVGELINYAMRGGTIAAVKTSSSGRILDGVKEVLRHKACFLRSSAIGTIIGIIPGVGGTAANFIAYIVAKQRASDPESFGTGNPEGVVASEAANNAKDGGALLPTVGFGIPGSAEMAILLGAFILHGLTPGPMLVKEHLDIVLALILGLVTSNIIASTLGLLTANGLARITRVNVKYIVPIVLAFCFVGAYAMREDIWDVLVTLVFGFFGYGMIRHGFSQVCLVIGFVLGVLAEKSFHQSLMMAYGSYSIFFSRPISLFLILLLLFLIIVPFIRKRMTSRS